MRKALPSFARLACLNGTKSHRLITYTPRHLQHLDIPIRVRDPTRAQCGDGAGRTVNTGKAMVGLMETSAEFYLFDVSQALDICLTVFS